MSKMREQLWRVPQGIVNTLKLKIDVKKKNQSDEDLENTLFPDNVITISNFKNNHFGCPLTQVRSVQLFKSLKI